MVHSSLICECVISHPFEENTYLVHLPGHQECLIVDPGMEPLKIAEAVKEKKLIPVAILNTHGHSDHIAGNEFCKQRWPECPSIIGSGDAPKLTDAELNLSAPFGLELISPTADQEVNEGDRIEFAGIELEVFENLDIRPDMSCLSASNRLRLL